MYFGQLVHSLGNRLSEFILTLLPCTFENGLLVQNISSFIEDFFLILWNVTK